ncbi:hypothetical protein MMC29_003517 [Sticta canariensis]|nr:hypothetical protein [Sticta canariensis]
MAKGNVGSEPEHLSSTHEWPNIITLGKVRLALRYTTAASGQASSQIIFWISAANIQRLSMGISKILDLVNHPGRDRRELSVRLVAAQQWQLSNG